MTASSAQEAVIFHESYLYMKHIPIPQLRIEEVINEENLTGRDHDFFVIDISNCSLHFQPIRHEFYLIALCTAGTMKITINLHEYTIEPNTLIVLSPQQIIQILEFSPDLRITNLFFKKDFLLNNTINSAFIDKLYIYKSDSCGNVRLEKENRETILTFFTLIEQKFTSDHPYKREMIKSFIVALLYEIEPIFKTKILEFHQHQKITRKEEIMKGFLDLLSQNLYKERSLKFYADALFISTQYLMEIVKEISGKTAGDLIDEAVILEAQVLLKMPHNNVAMVSELLNFSDQSFFGKFFKRKIGVSPLQYKNSIGPSEL